MDTATTRQIAYIESLRWDTLDRTAQATPAQLAEVLHDHDRRQAVTATRRTARTTGATREERRAMIRQASEDFWDAHPVEDYLTEARTILDREWEAFEHAQTVDLATVTRAEASAIIDRLLQPITDPLTLTRTMSPARIRALRES